jgi:hypothetical protein
MSQANRSISGGLLLLQFLHIDRQKHYQVASEPIQQRKIFSSLFSQGQNATSASVESELKIKR